MPAAATTRQETFWGITLRLCTFGLLLGGVGWGLDTEVSLKPRPRAPQEAGVRTTGTTIRVDVPLVLVSVTVNDWMNRIITGLRKENFSIKEDKIEQEITHFSEEDAPVSVGIIFDTSGSIGDKMSKCREAVAQFVKFSNPEDEYFLVQFNEHAELLVPFTRDYQEILNRLIFTRSRGRTAVLDAIYLGLREMERASYKRKALLIFSDGGDNSSRYNEREIKDVVKEADVQIYAFGMFEGSPQTMEELAGPGLLSKITEWTGGRMFTVKDVGYLPDIAAKIGLELRNQYLLGYIPAHSRKNGKWRRIRVKVKKIRGMPGLRAYARQGYYDR